MNAKVLEASKAPSEPIEAAAVVTFSAERNVYTAELSLRVGSAESKQRFVDARCETVADAIVLSVAIARDPSVLGRDSAESSGIPPAPEDAEPTAPRAQPGTDPESAPLYARTRRGAMELRACRPRRDPNGICTGLGAEGGVILGTVVRPSPSIGLRLLAQGARLGVVARGRFSPVARATNEDVAVDVRTGIVSAEIFPRFLLGESIELRPSVGAALYIHHATGLGFPENRTERQAAARATFGLHGGVLIGDWTLGAGGSFHAGRAVAFRGPTSTVARAGPVGVALGAMLERAFGPWGSRK